MTQPNVLFTTERAERHQQANLNAAPDGLNITMLRTPDIGTLKTHLPSADYWISERRGTINAELLDSAPNLKLIQRVGTLTYDIDLPAAQARGIIVCEQPLGSVIRVAEHAIMQMLVLTKRLNTVQKIALDAADTWGESQRTDENTFAYNWSKQTGIGGIWRKTIGILGFGEIGIELARRLQGFGCTVLYNKREKLPQSTESTLGLTYAPPERLFAESDIVVNLLPYSAATDNSLNAATFSYMKSGAYLVSVGSGSVIDESALANALESGTLSGVALDTYEYEPIRPSHPLIALANRGHNILLTPHTAAGNNDANVNERADIYTNIVRHLHGDPLLNRVV